MRKDTDSNNKSRSLQKYSGSHSTRKDKPRKDFPKKESSNTSYDRKEPVSYGSHYESSRERNNIDKLKVRESSPRKKIVKKRKKLDKKTVRTRILISVLGLSLCFVGVLFGSLMFRYSIISELKYEINTLTRDLDEIKNQKKEIEVQLEHSNRSDVIEKIAIEELQMQYPSDDQIVYIEID